MRETDFIEQNKNKWTELEELLHEERKDPDKLSNLFIQVTDDLSYSRTFYPNRSVRLYLNNIAQQIFYRIYKNKKEGKKQFIHFWKEELPRLIFEARKDLFFTFIVFVIALLIGIVSSANDAHFPRVILGNEYVNMTLENIKKGDPMAVYKKSGGLDMFLGITLNNIRVAFMTFVLGVFYAIGTIAMLIYNGIMVGTFQYFFYERGLFLPSFLSVWLHGTLEISSIIIAAGAGVTMGKGLIFPGTYSRLQSFLISSRRGFKILIGIVPIVVLAAIIESFMTRYTDMPDPVKGLIILLSLFFIVGYFVWYPFVKSRRGFKPVINEFKLPPAVEYKMDKRDIKSNGEIFKDIFIFYKKNFGKMFRFFLLLSGVATIVTIILSNSSESFNLGRRDWFFAERFFNYYRFPWMILVNTCMFTVHILFVMRLLKNYFDGEVKMKKWLTMFHLLRFVKVAVIVFLFNCIFYLNGFFAFLLILFVTPFFILWLFTGYYERRDILTSLSRTFSVFNISPGKVYGLFIMLALIGLIYFFMVDSPFIYFYFEIINWNLSLDPDTVQKIISWIVILTSFLGINLIFPMILVGNSIVYFSLIEMNEANGLKDKVQLIANRMKGVPAK